MAAGVSVIVPAFNASDTISDAIDSIRQSLAYAKIKGFPIDLEVVVVDDASEDDTIAVAEAQHQDEAPVRIVRHGVNQGAGVARNTGVAEARHEILCYLDADDIYLPNHLLVCAAAFAQASKIDFVSTRVRTSRPVHPSWIPALSASQLGALCIRKEAHVRIGGFPPYRHMEDNFYRRLADRFLTGWYVDYDTVLYTWRPGNAFDRQLARFLAPLSEAQLALECLPAQVVRDFDERIAALSGQP